MRGRRPKNPVEQCVLCLYRIGCGVSIVQRRTGVNKKLVKQWAERAGIYKPKGYRESAFRVLEKREIEARPKPVKIVREKLSDEEKKARISAYHKQKYAENPEKFRAKARESFLKMSPDQKAKKLQARRDWGMENPDKARAINDRWKAKNPERAKELSRRGKRLWKKNHPEKYREARNRKARRRRIKDSRELHDRYIKDLIREGTTLKRRDIPSWMVELQREKVRLIRQLKSQKL